MNTGLIGTIQMRYGGQSYPMSGTTPEAVELQRYLGNMAEQGFNAVSWKYPHMRWSRAASKELIFAPLYLQT